MAYQIEISDKSLQEKVRQLEEKMMARTKVDFLLKLIDYYESGLPLDAKNKELVEKIAWIYEISINDVLTNAISAEYERARKHQAAQKKTKDTDKDI